MEVYLLRKPSPRPGQKVGTDWSLALAQIFVYCLAFIAMFTNLGLPYISSTRYTYANIAGSARESSRSTRIDGWHTAPCLWPSKQETLNATAYV